MHIFLSYAREDSPAAHRLAQDLQKHGLEVWIDTEKLRPGIPWKTAITKAIRQSRFVICLLSKNSTTKRGFVQREIKESLDVLDEFPESDIFLIPARLEECEPAHQRLTDLQWVDLFPSYDTGLQSLIRSIEDACGEKQALDIGKSRLVSDPFAHRTDSRLPTRERSVRRGRLADSRLVLSYIAARPRIAWEWGEWIRIPVHQIALLVAAVVLENNDLRHFQRPSIAKFTLSDRGGLTLFETNISFTSDHLIFELEGTYHEDEGFWMETPSKEQLEYLWYSEFKAELEYEPLMVTDIGERTNGNPSYRRYVMFHVPLLK